MSDISSSQIAACLKYFLSHCSSQGNYLHLPTHIVEDWKEVIGDIDIDKKIYEDINKIFSKQ